MVRCRWVALTICVLLGACGGSDDSGGTASADGGAADTTTASTAASNEAQAEAEPEPNETTTTTVAATTTTASSSSTTQAPESTVEPLWPIVDGVLQMPDLPSTRAVEWVQTVAFDPDVTDEQLAERMAPSFLQAVPPDAIRSVAEEVRLTFLNDWEVVDARSLSEWYAWVAIGDPSDPTSRSIMRVGLDPNTELITELALDPWGVGVETASFFEDRSLTMEQVFAKLGETAEFVSAVVARVGESECEAIGGLNSDQPLATGSIYKQWVLGAAAQAVADGSISRDDTIAFIPGNYFSIGSITTGQFTSQFDLTVQQTANLMMNQSDNGATDMMEELLGREAIDAFVLESGHTDPSLLVPMLGVRDYNHLYTSIPSAEVDRYLDELSDDQQAQFLTESVDVLGVDGLNQFGNADRVREYTWRASPLDICNTMARLRVAHPPDSESTEMIDEAYGGETFWFGLRPEWDRVWTKGGGIPGLEPNTSVVNTYASMVESNEYGAYAVIIMFNSTEGLPNDDLGFGASSLGARLHQLILDMR